MKRLYHFFRYVFRPCPSGNALIRIRLAWALAGILSKEAP